MKKLIFLFFLILPVIIFPHQASAIELTTSNQFCNFTATGTGSSGQTSGNVTIDANNYPEGCVIYENVNGVSLGDLTVAGTALVLHKTLTFDPGHQINVGTGGVIWINTGGQIKQAKLCVKDADNDHYADTTTVTVDPNTGLPLTTTVTQIDYAIAGIDNLCPAGYNFKESMNDLSMVDTDVQTSDTTKIATSDRELLRLGFILNGITDALAAAGDVQLIDRNMLICTLGSCPATSFASTSGSLYVAGNVGIGSTSPESSLNILSATTPQLKIDNSMTPWGATGMGIAVDANGNTAITSVKGGSTQTNGYITIPYSKLGVGTDAPQTNLHVTGIANNQQLLISDTGRQGVDQGRLEIGYDTTNNYGRLQTWDDTSGAGSITINPSGGNIGIGTTTPGSLLTVGGIGNSTYGIYSETGVYGNSTLSGTGVYGSNNSSGKGVYGYNSSSGYGVYGQAASSGSGVYGYNTSNGEGVYGYNSATGYGVYGNNPSTGRGVFGNNSSSGQGVYGSSNTGIGGFFTSTSGPALVAYTGNVGIGTNAPGYKLDLTGVTTDQQFRIRSASTDVGGLGLLSVSNGTGLIFSGATYNSSTWIARNTTASIISLYNGTAQFFVNTGLTSGTAFTPTEVMRIHADGRVGIGTTTPSAPLTVSTYVSRSSGAVFSGAGSNAAWTTGFTTQNLNTSIAASNVIIGGGIYSVSDKRLKHNITEIPLSEAEKFISKANPVSFNWNDTGNFDTGFIAQDLIKQGFGHLVGTIANDSLEETTDSNGVVSPKGYQYVVSYDSIVPILTTLVKNHETKILDQQKEIDSLHKEIDSLENRLQKIEYLLNQNSCH